MSKYSYDRKQYHSPHRLSDPLSGEFVDLWETHETFDMYTPEDEHIHIPSGFQYDKGSVPRWAWKLIPRDDRKGIIPFLVHDFLYEKQSIGGQPILRKYADQIFYDLLRQEGMGWFRAKMAYRAVRLGGWAYWNKRNGNS